MTAPVRFVVPSPESVRRRMLPALIAFADFGLALHTPRTCATCVEFGRPCPTLRRIRHQQEARRAELAALASVWDEPGDSA